MILVQTKLGVSAIEGIGLFAAEFIAKGTAIWKFQPGFDLEIDEKALKKLSAPALEQFLKYSYVNPASKKYVLCFDDTRFFNHSDTPNTKSTDPHDDHKDVVVALRDIEAGEELTTDYREFHHESEKESYL